MGPIFCLEASVINYRYKLHKTVKSTISCGVVFRCATWANRILEPETNFPDGDCAHVHTVKLATFIMALPGRVTSSHFQFNRDYHSVI
jgi:hypothetical protein